VPYFMPNPFREGVSVPPKHAPQPKACDAACLAAQATQVMQAYVGNQWRKVNWADKVGYGENSVGIRVGEGVWATVTAIDAKPLIVADASTGKSVWIGRIEEHGQPAWAAVTVGSAGKQVGSVEAVIRRKEYGPLYAEPAAAPSYAELPKAQRTPWLAMQRGADAVYAAINAHGPAPQGLAPECRWFVNGQNVGGCAASFAGPGLKTIAQVRDRKLLAADDARGLVVYRTFEDLPAAGSGYPLTYQVVELFRFESGKIAEIQAFTSELPYGMKPHE
jgi:hypothetical protein